MTSETPLSDTRCPNCNGSVQVEDTDYLTCGDCGHHFRNLYRETARETGRERMMRHAPPRALIVLVEGLSFLIVVGIGLFVYRSLDFRAEGRPSLQSDDRMIEMQQRRIELEARRREIELKHLELQRQLVEAELAVIEGASTVNTSTDGRDSETDDTAPESVRPMITPPVD